MAGSMMLRLTTVRRALPDGSDAIQADAAGEALLAACVAGELAGLGGLTRDPAEPGALRMRRLYVRAPFRRFWEALGFAPDPRNGHTLAHAAHPR